MWLFKSWYRYFNFTEIWTFGQRFIFFMQIFYKIRSVQPPLAASYSHTDVSVYLPEVGGGEERLRTMRKTRWAMNYGENIIKRGAEWRGRERLCGADFCIWHVTVTGLSDSRKRKGYGLYLFCVLSNGHMSSQMSLSRTLTLSRLLLSVCQVL